MASFTGGLYVRDERCHCRLEFIRLHAPDVGKVLFGRVVEQRAHRYTRTRRHAVLQHGVADTLGVQEVDAREENDGYALGLYDVFLRVLHWKHLHVRHLLDLQGHLFPPSSGMKLSQLRHQRVQCLLRHIVAGVRYGLLRTQGIKFEDLGAPHRLYPCEAHLVQSHGGHCHAAFSL